MACSDRFSSFIGLVSPLEICKVTMAISHKQTKPSVSSGGSERKRSWRDKLDPDAVDMLDACSYLDSLRTVEEYDKWLDSVGHFRLVEDLPLVIPNRVEVMMLILELQKRLPKAWQAFRELKLRYIIDTDLRTFREALERLLHVLGQMQFGIFALTTNNNDSFVHRFFGILENICREKVVPPKGKKNIERAELVQFIRSHQRGRLTWSEMADALRHARANVPEDPEALRLWVWKAERKGLLPSEKRQRK